MQIAPSGEIIVLTRAHSRWYAEILGPSGHFAAGASKTPLPESIPDDPEEARALIQHYNPEYLVILEA